MKNWWRKLKKEYQGFRRVCQKHLDIQTDQNNVKTNQGDQKIWKNSPNFLKKWPKQLPKQKYAKISSLKLNFQLQDIFNKILLNT